ncbi:MAG: peptidyl-tRNA hydrolase Pth2 [Thermofilaceae archaeon]
MKQVIIVRVDLKMGKGKLAAQVAHAAVTASEITRRERPDWFEKWMQEGQRKVVLKTTSLEELLKLHDEALKLKLPAALISDMGLTQLPPGTTTALAIGPAPEELVDAITGHLRLL